MGSVLVATLEEGVLVLTLNRPDRRNAIDLLQSDDHREGLAAARERRDPVFRGA